MNQVIYCMWFYFGAIIGSFLNVVILRLPQNQKLSGRSHCMRCGHILSSWELFPLLSFLVLAGKCKACKAKISPRYFIIEALTGFMFLWAWYYFSPSSAIAYVLFFKSLFVIAVFVAIFVIDLEHFLILDAMVWPSIGVLVALNFVLSLQSGHPWLLSGYFLNGFVGMVIAGLFFFTIWYASKGKWMGFGDVKLALLLGVAFGWPLVGLNLFLAFLLGGIISTFLLFSGRKTMKSALPFGTFLTCAGIGTLFYGNALLQWYLTLIGL